MNYDHIFVTAGASYLDVDAYACCVACSELLRLQGIAATAFSSAKFNYSVSNCVLAQGKCVQTHLEPQKLLNSSAFIVVDVSDPQFFDLIVDESKIIAVIDHHVGFEEYWMKRLGSSAHIEFIGAAVTLIFEEWMRLGFVSALSKETAKIMLAGILDNTLNLSAAVTTQRDIDTKNKLCEIADVGDDWCIAYFNECQQFIESDLKHAIQSDIKVIRETKNLPATIGQLTIWDAQSLLSKRDAIESAMNEKSASWLINIISIKDKKSYFLCNDRTYQHRIEAIFGVAFTDDVAIAERMWLRKEILKICDYQK